MTTRRPDSDMGNLILPFLARFAPGAVALEPARLDFVSLLIGTMVDLYLVTSDRSARAAILAEITAHLALIVERLQTQVQARCDRSFG